MKQVLLSILAGVGIFGLIGCGGGSGGKKDNGNGTTIDLNLTKAINENKITGYDTSDPIEDRYLAVVNYIRSTNLQCNDSAKQKGPVGKLIWNTHLADSAEEHSEDMKLSVHYAHNGSGTINDVTGQTFSPARESTPTERMTHNSYPNNSGTMTAENIAMSSATYVLSDEYWIDIMEKWVTSTTGHCSNIMHPNLKDFGMHESRADKNASGWYNIYWTQNFGKE